MIMEGKMKREMVIVTEKDEMRDDHDVEKDEKKRADDDDARKDENGDDGARKDEQGDVGDNPR